MSSKKKVGLAGVMGMQSRPVKAPAKTTAQADNTSEKAGSKNTKAKTSKSVATKANKATTTTTTQAPTKTVKKKMLSKSKDQNFKLTGVYLRKTTVGQVKARLELREEDMSELVEELLHKWLKND